MADIDYDRLSEALADALERSGEKQEAVLQAKKIDETEKALLKLSKTLKDSNSAGKIFEKIILGQKVAYNNLQREIESLENQIEKTTNAEEERALRVRKDELDRAQQYQNLKAAVGNTALGFAKLSVQLGGTFASAGGQFVKGLQDGQSSIQLSSGLMLAGVEATNQTAQAASAGIQSLGQVTATSTNPKIKALGVAAQVAGMALGFAANKTSQLAKFGIEVLSKELEKTVGAYQRTSAAGALFADGMQGMRTAAGDAGLTVDQFSKVVSANSTTIAGAGFGVTDGTKRIGGALRAGGATMKQELLNLGYSFEEQAGLVAETMQRMKGAGGPLTATDAEVAESTKRYAENLRTIAAISGEDAKKRSEQVRQQATQLAFAQKLEKLDKDQRLDVLQAMENMSDQERKNFMDRVVFSGSVVNKEGAIMEAMSSGLRDAGTAYYEALQEGNLNERTARKISAENAEQQRKDYAGAIEIGIAGFANVGGAAQSVAEIMGKELQFRTVWTEEAIKSGEANAAAQKTTTNELTESLNKAAQASQDFALKLQKALDPLIASYSKVTDKMLEEINKTFKDIQAEITKTKTGADGKPTESLLDKTMRVGGKVAEGALTGATVGGLALGGVASVPLPVIGTVAGSVVGAVGGGLVGGLISGVKEWFSDKEGKARGGIARGPSGGFLEKLHGSEAVVPLPDGKTIPVHIEAPVAATMPTEPSSAFATQRLELTGIENIENMARSFVERPTGRLDAGFEQFLSEIRKTMTETTVAVQATVPAVTTPAEPPAAEVLKETIEQTSAVMSDLMREHTSLMRENLARVSELVSVTSDTKNINQQLLNNSY